MSEERQKLLEIYKLHAVLADNVSQRRAGANRLFVGLLTGIAALFAFFLRQGAGDLPADFITMLALIGIAICLAWWIVIRSYRQLNTGKFKTLQELEKQLPYEFFTREWEYLGKGANTRRYRELTDVENYLPIVLALPFLFVIYAYWPR